MLQTMPWSAIRRWNCSPGVLADLVQVVQQGIRLAVPPDGHQQWSVTSCAVIAALIDQPPPKREQIDHRRHIDLL